GVGIVYGWLQAALKGEQRYSDPEYLKAFRAYEFRNLVMGRHRNMEQTHAIVRATFPPKRPSATSSVPTEARTPSDVAVPSGS
ncbi:MAG: hypothetical protein KC983_07670, partial [Phycisphaerales bacterium]|nr:hypothetical protein [Phycisphaerales bacterium]